MTDGIAVLRFVVWGCFSRNRGVSVQKGFHDMGNDISSELQELLGAAFLRYTLGVVDGGDLSQALTVPSAGQERVLSELRAFAKSYLVGQEGLGRDIALANWLGHYLPSPGTTVANVLRQLAGATLPDVPPTGDPVVDRLSELLKAVYPLLLLPPSSQFPVGPHLASAVHNHPDRAAAEAAILQDPSLKQLFTAETEHAGWVGHVLRSSGQGGSIQLWGFPQQQFINAWEQAGLDAEIPSLSEVASCLSENINVIRRAVQGEPTTVTERVGLVGVLLPDSVSMVDLGWARLRSAASGDRAIAARTGLEGKLQTTTENGETVVINYAGDVVVEFDLPYVARIGEYDLAAGWPKDLRVGQTGTNEKIESIRCGLVLALSGPHAVNVVTSWQLTVDPLSTGLWPGWTDTRQVPNLVPRQLTEEEVNAWSSWAKTVQEKRPASIAVSLRRLLQSIGERRNPEDVLVDAVIVWENLFGAVQESTLRITSSLALLLGADPQDRKARQKEYKALYAARSGIVHGSASIKQEQLPEQARVAVGTSVAALRVLFSERTDLLHLATSEERSIAVLLGLPGKVK